jgi:hypothetical protein
VRKIQKPIFIKENPSSGKKIVTGINSAAKEDKETSRQTVQIRS